MQIKENSQVRITDFPLFFDTFRTMASRLPVRSAGPSRDPLSQPSSTPHRGRESPTILQEGPEMTSRRSKKQCFRKAPRGPMRRAPVSCSLDLPKLFRVVCRKGVMVGVAAGTLLHRTWRLLFFLRRRRVVPGLPQRPPVALPPPQKGFQRAARDRRERACLTHADKASSVAEVFSPPIPREPSRHRSAPEHKAIPPRQPPRRCRGLRPPAHVPRLHSRMVLEHLVAQLRSPPPKTHHPLAAEREGPPLGGPRPPLPALAPATPASKPAQRRA